MCIGIGVVIGISSTVISYNVGSFVGEATLEISKFDKGFTFCGPTSQRGSLANKAPAVAVACIASQISPT